MALWNQWHFLSHNWLSLLPLRYHPCSPSAPEIYLSLCTFELFFAAVNNELLNELQKKQMGIPEQVRSTCWWWGWAPRSCCRGPAPSCSWSPPGVQVVKNNNQNPSNLPVYLISDMQVLRNVLIWLTDVSGLAPAVQCAQAGRRRILQSDNSPSVLAHLPQPGIQCLKTTKNEKIETF